MALSRPVLALRRVDADDGPAGPVQEPALLARALAGDRAAFRALHDLHAPALRRFLHDLVRDPHLADECVQETFVRAFTRLETLGDGDRMLTWLLGIGRNVSREQLRARRRGGHLVALEPELPEQEDPGASAEELLLGREAQEALGDALGALSEDRRAALLLRVDHGLGCAEIGALMGWSVPKVKIEVHRARLQLRALLGERGRR